MIFCQIVTIVFTQIDHLLSSCNEIAAVLNFVLKHLMPQQIWKNIYWCILYELLESNNYAG